MDITLDSKRNRQGRQCKEQISKQVDKMRTANVIRVLTVSAHSQVLLISEFI